MIGHEAMELGAERAKQHGVCVVGLANAHHLGRIGHWAEQCIDARAGLDPLRQRAVAPDRRALGGSDARLGTNPFCVGIPRPGKDPIVLDFATSRIAQGKTRVAYNKGVRARARHASSTNDGKPTTDPRYTVVEPLGALLPFGEHKGSGLALVLRDARRRARRRRGGQAAGPTASTTSSTACSRSSSIRASSAPPRTWRAKSRASSPGTPARRPRPASTRCKIAGEPERETKKKRLAEGIPVDPTTWQEIIEAGKKFGLDQAAIEKIAG